MPQQSVWHTRACGGREAGGGGSQYNLNSLLILSKKGYRDIRKSTQTTSDHGPNNYKVTKSESSRLGYRYRPLNYIAM